MFTKRYALLLVLLAIIAAVAFYTVRSNSEKASDGNDWRPGQPLAHDKLRIGILYLDSANTSGYSFAHDKAISATQKELGLSDAQIIRKFNVSESDQMMIDNAMRECIVQGANIVIGTSWGYMDTCEKLAREHPNVVFAHASGYKFNETNFTNFFGRLYQARYVSGVIAGLKTRSGKIGFVAAKDRDSSEVTASVNAFALGVESVNPDAKVYVRVTHSWYDPAGESNAARRLLSEGCDVITQHCDTPNPQIEAEKAGVWGIGYNSDMSVQAPDSVLTSVVWHWNVFYTRLAKSVLDGTFSTAPYLGSMGEGMIDITPLNPRLTDDTMIAAVKRARDKVTGGLFNVFDGVLLTNEGEEIGTAGTTLADERITGGMHWYYHTVVDTTK